MRPFSLVTSLQWIISVTIKFILEKVNMGLWPLKKPEGKEENWLEKEKKRKTTVSQ